VFIQGPRGQLGSKGLSGDPGPPGISGMPGKPGIPGLKGHAVSCFILCRVVNLSILTFTTKLAKGNLCLIIVITEFQLYT